MKARVNLQISAPEVKLVDESGNELGVFTLERALEFVRSRGEDLVEIDPDALPPVCQVIDYGSYLYRLQQARNDRAHE
jgi:translation initiation factor IF-3